MPRHLDINYTPHGKPLTVDLDVSVAKGGKITELFNELVAHHERNGHEHADARDLAFLELATLYRTAHGKFRDHFVDAKGSLMDRLLDVEEQTLRFYDDILRGNKTPDVNQLRSLLGRMGQLFDELRMPAKKMVDDVEAQRAARAAETFEAVPATKPLDTPAQQRSIMTPDEKFRLLGKGSTISPDGGTATRTKDGVTFKASIDRSPPQQLVTAQITKPSKTEVIVEVEVRPVQQGRPTQPATSCNSTTRCRTPPAWRSPRNTASPRTPRAGRRRSRCAITRAVRRTTALRACRTTAITPRSTRSARSVTRGSGISNTPAAS